LPAEAETVNLYYEVCRPYEHCLDVEECALVAGARHLRLINWSLRCTELCYKSTVRPGGVDRRTATHHAFFLGQFYADSRHVAEV